MTISESRQAKYRENKRQTKENKGKQKRRISRFKRTIEIRLLWFSLVYEEFIRLSKANDRSKKAR